MSNLVRAGIRWKQFLVKLIPCDPSHKAHLGTVYANGKNKVVPLCVLRLTGCNPTQHSNGGVRFWMSALQPSAWWVPPAAYPCASPMPLDRNT